MINRALCTDFPRMLSEIKCILKLSENTFCNYGGMYGVRRGGWEKGYEEKLKEI